MRPAISVAPQHSSRPSMGPKRASILLQACINLEPLTWILNSTGAGQYSKDYSHQCKDYLMSNSVLQHEDPPKLAASPLVITGRHCSCDSRIQLRLLDHLHVQNVATPIHQCELL